MENFNKKIYDGKLKKEKIYQAPEPIQRRIPGMDDCQVNGTLLCNEKQKKLINNMVRNQHKKKTLVITFFFKKNKNNKKQFIKIK